MGARERLVELLEISGMTQAELARRVGEHVTWVNNRVRGLAEIKADDVPRLAAGLGLSPAAFFDEPAQAAGRSAELAALREDPELLEALSSVLLRVLSELPPRQRAALVDLARKLSDKRRGPAAARVAVGRTGSVVSEPQSAYIARALSALPEEDQDLVWGMVEARLRQRRNQPGPGEAGEPGE